MNLTAFQTFLAILETGSLVRASERLNVTQSTVTARLKVLEEELGQALFHRQKSGAQLTFAGSQFKRYAAAMMDLWRQARQETSRPPGIESVCNIGCHVDLWPELGRQMLSEIHRRHPTVALSAWPGSPSDLDSWLDTGLVNAVLAFQPFTREGRTTTALKAEPLILVSSRPDSPMRFDPDYVYVEGGEEFGRQHAAAYADAGIAKVSYGCALWALEHLLEEGGSAYLPERIAGPHLAAGRLYVVPDAPIFERVAYLITSDAAAVGWPWLPDLVEQLM